MTDQSSFIVKESEVSEPKTLFEHDIGLITGLLNQLTLEDISRVTLLKAYRLSTQTDLKQNKVRVLKVVLKSLSERNLVLQNGHELKRLDVFIGEE